MVESSSTSKPMLFEGIGAPVNVNHGSSSAALTTIDPTLDSCCQREIESNRQRTALETTLRAHDRVAKAEQLRQYCHQPIAKKSSLLLNLSFGNGCRCCFDPNGGDGGEYELLASAKRQHERMELETMNQYSNSNYDDDGRRNKSANTAHGSDREVNVDASESEDEFDYLLDCDIPTTTQTFQNDAYNIPNDYQSQRRADLQNIAYHNEMARYHGYGVHCQMHPRRVFGSVGYYSTGSDSKTNFPDTICPRGSVVHLYDASSPLSVSLDMCLEKMAKRYVGTKFVRGLGVPSMISVEGGDSSWKRGKLPMLLALKEGSVVAWSSGLHDFCTNSYGSSRSGNPTEVEETLVEQWLDHAGVLYTSLPPLEALCRIHPMMIDGSNGGKLRTRNTGLDTRFGHIHAKDENDDDEDKEDENEPHYYDCGMVGCHKTFFHEHVGVKNETQAGVLISESQVVTSHVVTDG